MTPLIVQITEAFKQCSSLKDKINLLNDLKKTLQTLSPFVQEPVDCVQWISADQIQANEYNPNNVASPEMALLYQSIKADGYTQPIVAFKLANGKYEIIDGFHRSRIGKEYKDIGQRIHNYLPLVILDRPLDERIGSTIRHNRARGTHQIRSMSDIVIDLIKAGWDDDRIALNIGMSKDEILRLKQVSGLKEAFSNHEFSKSWETFEKKYYPDEVGCIKKTISKKPARKIPPTPT